MSGNTSYSELESCHTGSSHEGVEAAINIAEALKYSVDLMVLSTQSRMPIDQLCPFIRSVSRDGVDIIVKSDNTK
jgi:hypothetical protein